MAVSVFLAGCFPDLDREETELEIEVFGWPEFTARVDIEVESTAATPIRQSFEGSALDAPPLFFEIESIPAGPALIRVAALDGDNALLRERNEMVVLVEGEELGLRLNLAAASSTLTMVRVRLQLPDVDPPANPLSAEVELPIPSSALAALGGPPETMELLALRLTVVPTVEVRDLTGIWEGPITAEIVDGSRSGVLASGTLNEDVVSLELAPNTSDLTPFAAAFAAGTTRLRVSGAPKDEGDTDAATVDVDLRFRISQL